MININWTLGLQFVNFVILMILLNFLLYRPLRDILARRRENIVADHGKAKALEGEIEEKMARYQEKLQEAKTKGHEERNALRNQAQQEEARIMAEARDEAGQHMKTIKNQVAAEADVARKTLQKESAKLADAIAVKVLGRAF